MEVGKVGGWERARNRSRVVSCYCEVFPHENHLSVLGKKQVGRHVTLGTISFGFKIKLIGETYWFIEEWIYGNSLYYLFNLSLNLKMFQKWSLSVILKPLCWVIWFNLFIWGEQPMLSSSSLKTEFHGGHDKEPCFHFYPFFPSPSSSQAHHHPAWAGMTRPSLIPPPSSPHIETIT